MDFILDNYMWFILGAVVILMTVVGYLAEKTDFASKKRNKKDENGSSVPADEPQIAMPDSSSVQMSVDNNVVPQTNTLDNMANTNTNMGMPTIDGVPSELFAPINSTDVVNIDSTTLGANLDQVVEPVNLSNNSDVKINDADGLDFDSLYQPVASLDPTDGVPVASNDNASNMEVQSDNMEDADAQVSTIEEEPSADPLFAVNTIPLSVEEEEKPPVDPWAADDNDSAEEVSPAVEEVPTIAVVPTDIVPEEQPVVEETTVQEVAPAVEEVPPMAVVPTDVVPEEQPVVEETTVQEVAPTVEEVPAMDVVPTDIVPEEQSVVEETTVQEVAPTVEEVPAMDAVPTDIVPEEQPVVEETTVQEVAPTVEEVPAMDVVPTDIVPEEQPVVEETTVQEVAPTVEEAPAMDVVPTDVVPEEQPVLEETTVQEVAPAVEENLVDSNIAPQPLLDLQFDQVSTSNEIQTDNDENVDNANGEGNEDVWQF